MGFDVNGTQFLLVAKAAGVNFERTAMIGRQKMHLLAPALKALMDHYNHPRSEAEAQQILDEDDRFAEPFLRALGAGDVTSYDASSYEGATYVHDMNQPIDDMHKAKYSVVIDGGSLEHIFNFPVAVKNCMEMIEVGGHYLGITPANNFMGHGFYQFSPELYFRVFSPENGFVTERVMIFEDVPNAQWAQLADPDVLGQRVEMTNSKPAYLLVQAQRTQDVEIFNKTPQQSDYAANWEKSGSNPT